MADDLVGDISIQISDQHASPSPDAVVVVEQTLAPGVRYAGWVPVSKAMLEDGAAMRGALEHAFDRHLRPWKFPDRNPMPTFTFGFDRWTQRARTLRALPSEVRRRVRGAWCEFRYGGDHDEDDW